MNTKSENKEVSTFDYLDSINLKKDDLMTPENENKYNSYIINHFLSGSIDTLFFANENNQRPFLDKRLQYDYLKHAIRKKYRRSKWLKPDQIENLKIIQKYYGCNTARAKEALNILSDEAIQMIKMSMDIGGTK